MADVRAVKEVLTLSTGGNALAFAGKTVGREADFSLRIRFLQRTSET